MKLKWSKHWNASKRPSKQRKYRYNAPLHVQHTFLAAHLSPELRKKYTTRSFTLRKGDKVKILRGQHKKKTGKVSRILIKSQKIYIEGIELSKKDGSKVLIPLDPSNLMITELDLTDKIRKAKIENKKTQEKK
ncbi:MAG: large subunit ribosomal protein L24 [archaeon GW2011_AR17]|nr:large subunit ribosomal protein L24 [uncultured archaeon]KHO52359.1 MAG: large subunit ribosomal protein L24 [archaeon GW2011_AR17]MBS3154303.1 50S ribosomal protein L24 [Candidatus Woesearchaeota archaeon]HIH15243.1 50S ribosomal protein L24 [Nanoarchaeota archaeon]HIH58604.1 50S ribosomal protein L24 [Nanoarchaeota archaeon]